MKKNYAWQHFKTITHHKCLVLHYCFRMGLYWQGIVHDLSKYSPTEFREGPDTGREPEARTMQNARIREFPLPGFIIRDATSTISNIGLTMV